MRPQSREERERVIKSRDREISTRATENYFVLVLWPYRSCVGGLACTTARVNLEAEGGSPVPVANMVNHCKLNSNPLNIRPNYPQ
jgi:hypothetical protein